MNWIAVKLTWPNLTSKKTLFEAKKDVLLKYVDSLMKKLKQEDLVETANYTFQDPQILLVLSLESDTQTTAGKICEYLEGMGLQEGENQDFTVDKKFFPNGMKNWWGKNHMETFARLKDLSSTLAIEAIKGNLGESYNEHRISNRPSHIWLNQLGCDHLDEAEVYFSMAASYLSSHLKQNFSDQKMQLNQLQHQMEVILEALEG